MRPASNWRALVMPRRALFALAAALLLAEGAASLVIPWLGGALAGALFAGQAAIFVAAMILVALALQSLLRFASAYALDRAADEIIGDLRLQVYAHLQALPVGYFQRSSQGEALALLTSDVYVVGGYLSHTLVSIVPLAMTAVGAAFMMLRIEWTAATWLLLLIPLCVLVMKLAGRRIRPLTRRLQDEEARAIALVQENLRLLPAIKSFTRENHERQRFTAQLARIRALAAQQRPFVAGLGPLMQFIATASIVVLLAATGNQFGTGPGAAAGMVSLFLYAQLLARPAGQLADVYGITQVARASWHRILEMLREEGEPSGGAGLTAASGDIEFRGVSFAYPGRSPVLRDLHLRIAAGEVVALVGPNGAGKSTLAHLLSRLQRPDAGSIRIGNVDIAEVSLESLRSRIGVVAQEAMLFNASIADNIAYGLAGADKHQVEVAARAAQAHRFISQLPEGYATRIGDDGMRLSGGERQRIMLARALLKDPPILVLDEATAMFDPAAEEEFLAGCGDAFRGRTVILITHRSAALSIADRVLHLERSVLTQVRARGPVLACSSFASSR
jgi:ATP-binding cassette subfamily B protein